MSLAERTRLELHDNEKKIEMLQKLKEISKDKKEISIMELSKLLDFNVDKLNIFLEELILTDKIKAKIDDEIISFL